MMEITQRETLLILFLTCTVEVLSCNLPQSERLSCGYNIQTRQECVSLNCCYDDQPSHNSPRCYYRRRDAAGGPIKHANGLCLYPKDGSTADNTSLVWSNQCSNKNALFLVSWAHSTYHIASGKCILPQNGNGPDPGTDTTLVLGSNCGTVGFEAVRNGNLAYYYSLFPIRSCIGEGEGSVEPLENDLVKISKEACVSHGTKHHLKYVYQKNAKKGTVERLRCPGHSVIDVTWAYYGQLRLGLPTRLTHRQPKCETNVLSKIQKSCNGKSFCSFGVRNSFFGKDCHGFPKHSIVRYTCKSNSNSVQSRNQLGGNVSLTSFDIPLNRLKRTELHIQVVVLKLSNKKRPKLYPGHYKPSVLKDGMKDWVPSKPYIAAELSKRYVNTHPWFTVGDGLRHGGYLDDDNERVDFINVKLEKEAYYTVFVRTFVEKNLYHDSEWMDVVQTKDTIITGKTESGQNTIECIGVAGFIRTWKDMIFIGVIAIQFVINIVLGCLVFCKICKRHSKTSKPGDDLEVAGNEDDVSKKNETRPERVSHQYEYPSLGCRRQQHRHSNGNSVVNGYEDLRLQTGTEYEHVYHSLKTL